MATIAASGSSSPLRIAIINDCEIVVAGVADMLVPYADRVDVVELDHRVPVVSDVDIILCDMFALVEGDGQDIVDLTEGRVKVVVYTWATHEDAISRALAQGASAYLSKALTSLELVEALEAVHEGQEVIRTAAVPGSPVGEGSWPGMDVGLTVRESEVLALIAKGLTNEEVARAAFLSINTVKTHIRKAYTKIGAGNRSQAVAWALRNGLGPATFRRFGGGGRPGA